MSYHWEGDLILQDCSIERKRYVIGNLKKAITTDIREWISFEDDTVMKGILKDLVEAKKLPTSKNPGDFDRRAMAIWEFVATHIKYVYDTRKQRKEDFWLFPPEIYTMRQGDCEDGSFLLASLLIAAGVSPFCVRVVLGEVLDEKSGTLGGHCWPIYKNETGAWCILESTLDVIPKRMPEADPMAVPGQYFQYVPYYCFNNHHLWEILPDPGTTPSRGIEKYLAKRRRKIHMRRTKLPSGGWLSHITGDWQPGHLEITAEALRSKGFSEDAIDVAADASQDPDFYHWYAPHAHAQTDNDAKGRTTQTRDEAVQRYVEWIGGLHGKLQTAAARDVRRGLFYLGYLLHGVQDLATHQGITNAQHAYLTAAKGAENDPDHSVENRAKSLEFSGRYLDMVKRKLPALFGKLAGWPGRPFLWERLLKGEKEGLLGRGWDISFKAYRDYKALGPRYGKIRSAFPVERARWDANGVMDRFLNTI